MKKLEKFYNLKDIEWYNYRTKNHINQVKNFAKLIDELFNLNGELIQKVIYHDRTKWIDPEFEPYILITKRYKWKNEYNKELNFPDEINRILFEATFHHIKNNDHHPEFWDPEVTYKSLNYKNRDDIPEKIVNATKMPDICIYEMCADWLAVSGENENTALEWAGKTINNRWKFNSNQIDLIYKILNKFEK